MGKERKPKKTGKKTDIIENIGKVLINLGQLMFGTLFLGSVLRGEMPQYIITIAGFAGAIILITIGLIASAKERKTTEE
jgi:putative Mn2+ efflux pump MntP